MSTVLTVLLCVLCLAMGMFFGFVAALLFFGLALVSNEKKQGENHEPKPKEK